MTYKVVVLTFASLVTIFAPVTLSAVLLTPLDIINTFEKAHKEEALLYNLLRSGESGFAFTFSVHRIATSAILTVTFMGTIGTERTRWARVTAV